MKNRSFDALTSSGSLSVELNRDIGDYAEYLISLLPQEAVGDHADGRMLGQPLSDSDLKALSELVGKKRIIGSDPIVAMLCAHYPGLSPVQREMVERLKAWMLLATLSTQGNNSAIKTGCAQIRLINKNDWLLSNFKTVGDLDTLEFLMAKLRLLLASLQKPVGKGRGSGREGLDAKKLRCLEQLLVPLKDLEGRRGDRDRGPDGPRDPFDEVEEFVDRSDIDLGVGFEGVECALVSDAERPPDDRVSHPYRSRSGQVLDIKIQDREVGRHAILKNRASSLQIRAAIEMRSVGAPCSSMGMTKAEGQTLLTWLWPLIENGDHAAAWLASALFLGRTLENILALPHEKFTGLEKEWWVAKGAHAGQLCIAAPPVPKMTAEIKQVLTPTEPAIFLDLPSPLGLIICDSLKQIETRPDYRDVFLEEAKKCLQGFARTSSVSLSVKKLSTWLPITMSRAGVSRDVIRRLGPSEDFRQRYDASYVASTIQPYREAIKSLFDACGMDNPWIGSVSGLSSDSELRFGSSLLVKPDTIEKLFMLQARNVEALRGRKNELGEFHNEYVLYTYLLLMLGSGYRGVRMPVEEITDYDRHSGELFICDKAKRTDADSRTVVLPMQAQSQIAFYVEHLKRVEIRLRRASPSWSLAADKALRGTGPLLFWMGENRSGDPVTHYLRPSNLMLRFKKRLPLPLNWTRTVLRTRLLERGFAREVVDEYLNHNDDEPPGRGRFSGISYADLANIGSALTSIFSEWGIRDLMGWDE